MTPDDWRDAALCAQVDLAIFFPGQGDDVRPAKSICHACEVRAECLEWAMAHTIRYGIWGETTAREREKMRRLPRAEPEGKAA